ncbi:MAG: GNAT family N-acetyltransferase [Gemmatimonadaceae bacterium]
MALNVRDIALADLGTVARIHRDAFPRSALGALGSEAVRRYYHWQLVGPHDALALGALLDDALVGFCFAGVFRGALSGFVRANRAFLIWSVVRRPWLLTSPLLRERVRLAVRSGRPPSGRVVADRGVPREGDGSFGVLSIAVDPRFSGRGIGTTLMDGAEGAARSRGFASMSLTVEPHNEQAVRFYEHLGWTRALREGMWNGMMTKAIAR